MNTLFENFYCCRYLDDDSKIVLKQFLERIGIIKNNTGFEYHCTIMFSKDKFPSFTRVNQEKVEISLGDFDLFGDYLVIRVESDELRKDFQKWIDLGCNYSYDDYKPHISILKDYKTVLTKKQLKEIMSSSFSGKLYLGQEFTDLSK